MRNFLLWLTVLAILSLHPCVSHAQAIAPSESIEPSEPVEDVPVEPEPPKKPPAAKKTDKIKETDLPPPPPEEKLPEPNAALLQGLNKVTARIVTIEVPMNVTVPFGTLGITLKKCWRAPPDEKPENAALLEIIDHKPGEEPAGVFSGWMFSSSPAISALEHPVYDVTMIECIAKNN